MPERNPKPLPARGVAGPNAIVLGGLEREHLYLIEDTPGSGKTTLALQFPAGAYERSIPRRIPCCTTATATNLLLRSGNPCWVIRFACCGAWGCADQKGGELMATIPFYTTVIAPVAVVSVGWLSAILHVRVSLRERAGEA